MNTRAIVLVSILCNIGLLAWAYHLHQKRGPSADQSAISNSTGGTTVSSLRTAKSGTAAEIITNEITAEFRWQQVESKDYKAYIANLRSIGCPEETIRDIIVADVSKLYAQKRRAIYPQTGTDEYWKKDPSWRSVTSEETEKQKTARALEKEKRDLLKELLGMDPLKARNEELGYVDYYERMYGFLSPEKQQQVRDIQEKIDEELQPLYRIRMRDAEDEMAIRQLQKEKLSAVAGILSPQEFEEFELRISQTANQMRYDLDAFNPTPDEFRQIYKIRKEREDDYIYDPDDQVLRDNREKNVAEIDRQVKEIVGEQRFNEYKRSQDYTYKELVRTLARNELPPEIAGNVYDMKKAAEDAAKRLQQDDTLTPEQRKEALTTIRTETETAVSAKMGDKAFKAYKRSGGYWMNNLGR
jgi:hypothetical protein